MRARVLVLVVGAAAAALLLASAGAGLAMQLGSQEAVAAIQAGDADPAAIQKRIAARRAELERQSLTRIVKTGNRQALLRYLRRHTDTDPSRVVIQRGERNYAGPNCPGRAWNCTTARQVVQISLDDDDDDNNGNGGGNTFSCEPSAGPDNPCVILQASVMGTNSAECVQRTNDMAVAALSCDITQTNTSGSNTARVEQDVNHSSSGGVQNARETAVVTQTNQFGHNHVNLVQDIDLTMSGTIAQMQDAHQRAELILNNTSGNNSADVLQTQDLDAQQDALVVDQRQNTQFDTSANCVSHEPDAPNSCASIYMSTGSGDNDLDLDQSNDLTMSVGGGGDDDDGDDDGADHGADNGDDGGNGDDDGDDNGDDNGNGDDDGGDNGGSSSVTGFQQQGTCEGGPPCSDTDNPDGGTEAGIDMFSTSGNTNSHMTGLASADMPGNTPDIEQLQFTDPFCCYGTFFTGESARAEIDLTAFMDAHENSYQTGENGVACVVQGGDCSARMTIRTEDGTFSASGEAPVLVADQQCTHGGGEITILQDPCTDPTFSTIPPDTGPD